MLPSTKDSVLVVYALLQWPWRKSLEDHLLSFRRYGSRSYHYVNLAVPGLALPYSAARYGAVVWHTSVLSFLRWSPDEQQRGLLRRAGRLKGVAPFSVALPQDEFLRSDAVNRFLVDVGVDHVFSVAPPSQWPKIYSGLDRDSVGFSRVLTGYLDTGTVARVERIVADDRPRPIDIGYRTVPGKPFLGRHAILKVEIANAVRNRAEARGLRVDISTKNEDTFYGDDWYRFLASCRYTIGMEGGASVLDRDGSVRNCVEGCLAHNPKATFEELEAACFPGRDGELELFALSPRHLEACATRTPQILIEGEYAGILRPDEHYLSLRRDLSNLDEVLDMVERDRKLPDQLAARAHADVVASGGFTYRRLVEEVENQLPAAAQAGGGRRLASVSYAVDLASRPLVPLATRALMPARRRILGAVGAAGYERDGRPARRGSKRVGGVLLLYHRPITPRFRDASTVVGHASSFRRYSRLGVVEANTDLGFPPALEKLEFGAVILHYSLFSMAEYHLDERFRRWLRLTGAYKVAFFQDEYFAPQRRFVFLDEQEIDCVYTCLDQSQFDSVYRKHTSVRTLRSTLPGYAGEEVVAAARRLAIPDEERAVDVGYRGRPLPAYLGRAAQEKGLIGARFAELAAGSGLRLDIAGGEQDRLYGSDWYGFLSNCCCVLGVESGASAFDLEGEVFAEYDRLRSERDEPISVDDLESLRRWDGVIDVRTIGPRHFEAAAFEVCQVLFEGHYSGVMEAGRHYIPLRKDFSNFDEVVRQIRDPDVRRRITRAARDDLIDSRLYSYGRFVRDVDETLVAAGVEPLRDGGAVANEIARGEPRRKALAQLRWVEWGVRHRLGRPREQELRP